MYMRTEKFVNYNVVIILYVRVGYFVVLLFLGVFFLINENAMDSYDSNAVSRYLSEMTVRQSEHCLDDIAVMVVQSRF